MTAIIARLKSVRRRPAARKLWPLFAASLWVVLAAVLGLLLQRLPHANLSVMFLVVVVIIAARYGLVASLYAAVLSFFIYNFFFTEPLYTLWVNEEGDLATLVFFVFVAALSGHMASRLRDALERREAALKRLSNLYEFSHRMVRSATGDDVLEALRLHVMKTFDAPVTIELDTTGHGDMPDAEDGNEESGPASLDMRRIRMHKTDHGWRVELNTPSGRIGELLVERESLNREQKELLRTLADHAALAYERTRLAENLQVARTDAETECLRASLLASVSHDLRTPLASILGSATSLLEYDTAIAPADRRELLESIADEARRLNRYIQNLLDMTRVGQGAIKLHRDWIDLNDVLAAVRRRLDNELRNFRLQIRIEEDVGMLYVHGALLEQALVNVVENAVRIAPEGSSITIHAHTDTQDAILIDVIDEGPGIPEGEREKIFDMFCSVSRGSRAEKGTGLGLAICRSLIGAHGGQVLAMPGPGGKGTCIRLSLPARKRRE